MASASVNKLIERANSARASLARIRAERKESEARLTGLALGGLGAVGAAYADARFGEGAEDIKVFGVPVVLAVAGVGVVAAAAGEVPASDKVLEFSKGALYYQVGRMARDHFEETKK